MADDSGDPLGSSGSCTIQGTQGEVVQTASTASSKTISASSPRQQLQFNDEAAVPYLSKDSDSSSCSAPSTASSMTTLACATADPVPAPQPANAANGGRELNKKVLHVGGIDHKVTENMLMEIFKVTGEVLSIKMFPDKNRRGFVYAFIEYHHSKDAMLALTTLNSRAINNSEIKINWAYQTQQAIKDSENFNLFVGDLASEVNDEMLSNSFAQKGYKSIIEARVMWDMSTGRSRGYGFVSFRDRAEAEQAIVELNHTTIGSRQIRVNWAEKKHAQPSNGPHHSGIAGSPADMSKAPLDPYSAYPHHHAAAHQVAAAAYQALAVSGPLSRYPAPPPPLPPPHPDLLSYEVVVRQAPSWQSTIYVGNLSPYTSTAELLPILQSFGYIVGFKHQPDRGYAFVKYDGHEVATIAILQLSGYPIAGRALKVGWGKSRTGANTASYGPQANNGYS